MKFTVSFASVALVILALLLWVEPGGALPAVVPPGHALFSGAWPGVSRFGVARLGFAPGGGADPGLARPSVARPSGAQSPIKTIYPTFTTIDVPGEPVTEIYGINSQGDMVGFTARSYYDPKDRGFLYKGGKFMRVVYPGAYATLADGINDAGLVVGTAKIHHGYATEGFTYDGITFDTFRDENNEVTNPYGINNSGDIVGGAGTLNTTKGFLATGRRFTVINFPGNNIYADATSVNKFGEIVGFTDYDAYSDVKGQFQNIDVPGAVQTEAWGINDSGVISGNYFASPAVYGFALYTGQYISFSYPGAEGTFAYGISPLGRIVGWYTFDYVTYHGFVTSPITAANFQ